MGQLEKYGLYVLCLVIFLILGVTIWGGGETPPVRVPTQPIRADVSAPQQPTGNLAQLAEDIFRQPAPEPTRPAPVPAPAVLEGGGANVAPASLSPAPVTPTPAPAVAAAPAVYKVQKGDSFATIARAKLGKESMWTEIQRLNPDVQPSKLREGQELKLPAAGTATASAPAAPKAALDKPLPIPADGMRDYVVRKGDTFDRIAQTQLGSRKRSKEVQDANPSVKATSLRAGATIKLPKK